ncbi:hypothetical protein XFPR_12420 [Xylella fastidiosa]|uniref:Uncharacterized protein n=1 Tax=Xylella fastidiosa (strain 9a5c) TaxID=160492 RepID=Q9PFL8_XYLFA|nr:hypothetical protein [Xylella fastidiosa]AAF83449.1 hypothetical protein XF_0639 [Xylella fastidiosa 9a5c]QPB72985.1 hypothetical protein XFPR_12420 [Xylella fastidiosa]WGZ32494.1 hypothetical protein O4444_02375 [Xylella fastidiosa subsp. pauca]WGZ34824.1 hypothetical protein O4445_02650 [Xylella fastidiosa subsp. pauca]WGZ37099.1 hypothetical protein O4443_02635 [Xylella fastidiosa subsp. pauca]
MLFLARWHACRYRPRAVLASTLAAASVVIVAPAARYARAAHRRQHRQAAVSKARSRGAGVTPLLAESV